MGGSINTALWGRDLKMYVANLCLDVNLLKVMLVFWSFVFSPIVVVTVLGEVCAECVCGSSFCQCIDSVLTNSVQVIASILSVVSGELLPFQAFPLSKCPL